MRNRAFTLVELLVVIAIIGTLISISVVGWVSVAQRGRDSTRKNDLARIKQVLQQQFSDTRTYPVFEKSGLSLDQPIYAASWQLTKNIAPNCVSKDEKGKKIAPLYIAEVPKDPQDRFDYEKAINCAVMTINQANRYIYLSSPTTTNGPESPPEGFGLMATLEQSYADRLADSLNPLKSPDTAFGKWYSTYDNYSEGINDIGTNANFLIDSRNQ